MARTPRSAADSGYTRTIHDAVHRVRQNGPVVAALCQNAGNSPNRPAFWRTRLQARELSGLYQDRKAQANISCRLYHGGCAACDKVGLDKPLALTYATEAGSAILRGRGQASSREVD